MCGDMSSPIGDTSRLLVLLGAGASAEAGVPMSFDMTQQIVALISHDYSVTDLSHRPKSSGRSAPSDTERKWLLRKVP